MGAETDELTDRFFFFYFSFLGAVVLVVNPNVLYQNVCVW